MIKNTNSEQLVITRDGEVTHEFEPSALQTAAIGVSQVLATIWSNLKDEVRVGAYDALHGTDYLASKHDEINRQAQERFEASIGYTALKKK